MVNKQIVTDMAPNVDIVVENKRVRRYLIKEIFYTIQGEGDHAGEAAVFVRFSACNLACTWCDTDYTGGEKLTAEKILERVSAVDGSCGHEPRKHPIVVLTGGEPSLQVDDGLLDAFRDCGYNTVTMETNGILWREAMYRLKTITVSPKTINGWWASEGDRLSRWRQVSIKVVYDPSNPLLPTIMARAQSVGKRTLFLQPLEDQVTKATNVAECIEVVKRFPEWKLSLQTHKILGLR